MLERNFFKDWYDWVLERSRGSGNVRQWGHWQPNWASHTGRSLERRQRPAWLLTEPTTAGSTFHWWPAEDFSDLLCRTAELPLRNSKLWSANWLGPFFLRESRAAHLAGLIIRWKAKISRWKVRMLKEPLDYCTECIVLCNVWSLNKISTNLAVFCISPGFTLLRF